MYAIEKNIPMPKRSGGNKLVYPFRDMIVGDSFVVPFDKRATARASSMSYARRNKGVKFSSRCVSVGTSTGVRIWRTA